MEQRAAGRQRSLIRPLPVSLTELSLLSLTQAFPGVADEAMLLLLTQPWLL
jgi:hypothetical protein